MLGVIIGVSTVIAVFAIGQGAQSAVDEQFAGLSAKSILVMGTRGGTASSKLAIEDVASIREQAKNIGRATGVTQGSVTVSYDSLDSSFIAVGTDLEYFAISNLNLSAGRLFAEDEMDSKARVVVIGSGW